MTHLPSRRTFLRTAAAAGTALGAGEWATLLPLSPTRADEIKVTPDLVRFGPELEPVVRLIEETPREKCPPMMIEQLKKGLPYRHFLAALFLANLRTLGMAHPLAVLHSTNQLTLDAPVAERLLPTFYALDSFKFHQTRQRAAPNLKPLGGDLPAADQAEAELHAAMKAFDHDKAERAVVALVRTQGAQRVGEALFPYGARDWHFIGHLPIWLASAWRTLQTIGWQHAEQALRVTVRSLIGGDREFRNQPYPANRERVQQAVGKLPGDWARAEANAGFTRELVALLRDKKTEPACQLVAAQLAEGKVRAGAVWDAVHLAAGEIILNRPADGAGSLHSNTSTNALRYFFETSADPATRLLALLQAVGFICLFSSGRPARDLLKFEEPQIADTPEAAADDILAVRSAKPEEAARQAFAFAKRFPHAPELRRAAGRLLPTKSNWDPHHLKFPVAMFENCGWVSAEWRPHLWAATAMAFKGSDLPDMPVMHQVREALGKL